MNDKSNNIEERIMWYIDHPDELEKLIDEIDDNNEMTIGRIRTIYARVNYGNEDINKIAKYYNLPIKIIRDICNKKIFANITNKSFYI